MTSQIPTPFCEICGNYLGKYQARNADSTKFYLCVCKHCMKLPNIYPHLSNEEVWRRLHLKIEKTERELRLLKQLRNFLEQNYPPEKRKHLVLWGDPL